MQITTKTETLYNLSFNEEELLYLLTIIGSLTGGSPIRLFADKLYDTIIDLDHDRFTDISVELTDKYIKRDMELK